MNIRMKLDRLLPHNREEKWPVWVQFLVFMLLESLFIWGNQMGQTLVYGGSIGLWAEKTFGLEIGYHVLTVISILVGVELCAWRIGLQRDIPFGGHAQRRWTILPYAVGYGALSLLHNGLLWAFQSVELALPTENLYVYAVACAVLFAAVGCVFCALVDSLRRREKARTILLAAAEVLLAGLLILCSAGSRQIEMGIMTEAVSAAETQPTIVTVFGDPDSFPEGVTIKPVEQLDQLLESAGIDPDNVMVVCPEGVTTAPAEDPLAAYQEAVRPVDRLSTILQWIRLIPLFFAMRRWLFRRETETEEAAEVYV